MARSRTAHGADGEAGFTIVELAIVVALLGLVMSSLLGTLQSQTKAERRVSALADNQELVRQALVAMQRDLRSAEPLVPLADATAYPSTVELRHLDFTTGAPSLVRWRVDAARGELVREQLRPADRLVLGTTHRLRGVRLGQAVFRYFGATGTELTAGTATSSTIALCTVRMRVTIAAAPTAGPAPLEVASEVDLRNRRPGNRACDA